MTHDLLHRSPLAVDIRRMWQDAISDDAGNDTGSEVILYRLTLLAGCLRRRKCLSSKKTWENCEKCMFLHDCTAELRGK